MTNKSISNFTWESNFNKKKCPLKLLTEFFLGFFYPQNAFLNLFNNKISPKGFIIGTLIAPSSPASGIFAKKFK
ncbi:hypothetical protein BpHYR1_047106 [Brachionus plicatilis]|uniref:Uncharacterized protein n=1 Tax=Brachionus plicatilis TaxID=10195 RepID=A0A3M7Q0G1_BRAPC|nr:hypothetical protein BpHYR1_047106 [Brachionus plicatilis]